MEDEQKEQIARLVGRATGLTVSILTFDSSSLMGLTEDDLAISLDRTAERDPEFAVALVGMADNIDASSSARVVISPAGIGNEFWKAGDGQGGVPQEAALHVPVTIYLSEADPHEQVQAAVEDLLHSAGLSVRVRESPIEGSWFQRIWASVSETAKSPIVREEALAMKHALDQRIILEQDADITAKLLQNLGPVLASLHDTKDAVLRVGALLVVKVDWTVEVLQLTAAQQAILDHHPHLAAAPGEILMALKSASMNADDDKLNQPRGLTA
jgi:hypothetical protein